MATQEVATGPMATVDKMYQCFGTGDMETIKNEVFAPDIEWALPGHHPLSGTKHGADEVLAFFGALMAVGRQRRQRLVRDDRRRPGRRDPQRPRHGRGPRLPLPDLQRLHDPRRQDRARPGLHGRPARRRRLLLEGERAQAHPRPARLDRPAGRTSPWRNSRSVARSLAIRQGCRARTLIRKRATCRSSTSGSSRTSSRRRSRRPS